MSEDKATGQETRKDDKSHEGWRADTVEWILGAVSAVIVIAMVGFLLFQALTVSEPKPQFAVRAAAIEQRGEAYHVAFRALNRGEATAAEVTVEGRLMDGDRSIETSQAKLDYLPARSQRAGALLFRNDPNNYRLLLEVKGYSNP